MHRNNLCLCQAELEGWCRTILPHRAPFRAAPPAPRERMLLPATCGRAGRGAAAARVFCANGCAGADHEVRCVSSEQSLPFQRGTAFSAALRWLPAEAVAAAHGLVPARPRCPHRPSASALRGRGWTGVPRPCAGQVYSQRGAKTPAWVVAAA